MEAGFRDNYTYSGSLPGQVIMSLSDGMGSGEAAAQESQEGDRALQQLLETGFSARSALKMVNTILLLTGVEQHPATLDLCCVDLCSGVLEAMKDGERWQPLCSVTGRQRYWTGNLPAGVISQAEPVLLSANSGMMTGRYDDGWRSGGLPGLEKERSLKEYLESMPMKTPQDMAERILRFAHQNGGMKDDDMTVLVAGIWKR